MKIQAIRAVVDELDAAKLAWDGREDPQLASITDAQYNRHHAAIAKVDWEAIARHLLPIVEAAQKVNALSGAFYDERLYCRHCSAEVGRPHHKDCYIGGLEDALKGLEE